MMLADRLSGWNGLWPGMSCAIAALCCTFMAGQKTSHGAWVEWKREGEGNTCSCGKVWHYMEGQITLTE